MAGSISILGLGSSALNADTIDKLRQADEGLLLRPVERRTEKNIQQRDDFTTLLESLQTVQDSVSVFADELTYLKRTTSFTGDGGNISAESGVSVQSGQIHVTQLAQKSIHQSRGHATENSIISAGGGDVLSLTLGSKNYDIDITTGMSLSDLRSAINEATKGEIEASILNTGGDEGYSLILKSKNTGTDNDITISATGDFDLGFAEIQKGQNANFAYNGIEIQRSTNEIDDLLVGVKITLTQENEYINFDIKQDLEGMGTKFQEFVDSYNEAVALIDTLTDFDSETKKSASFQGDTRVTSIRTSITGILFSVSGNNDSITEYGLEVDQKGKLVFDSAEFEVKMSKDTATFESFFRGKTTITEAITVSNKVGYSTQEINEILDDGTIQTTTQYLPIAEDKKLGYGSMTINGIKLPEIILLATNTPKENTQLLVEMINSLSYNTGVIASVSGNGDKVVFSSEGGGEVGISGVTSDASAFLGVENGRVVGSRDYSDGLFNNISTLFEDMLDGEFSTFGLLETSLQNETKTLDEERLKVIERLDSRYDIMKAQFASYNSIIKRFESSFNSLQMQIDQSMARN